MIASVSNVSNVSNMKQTGKQLTDDSNDRGVVM